MSRGDSKVLGFERLEDEGEIAREGLINDAEMIERERRVWVEVWKRGWCALLLFLQTSELLTGFPLVFLLFPWKFFIPPPNQLCLCYRFCFCFVSLWSESARNAICNEYPVLLLLGRLGFERIPGIYV